MSMSMYTIVHTTWFDTFTQHMHVRTVHVHVAATQGQAQCAVSVAAHLTVSGTGTGSHDPMSHPAPLGTPCRPTPKRLARSSLRRRSRSR